MKIIPGLPQELKKLYKASAAKTADVSLLKPGATIKGLVLSMIDGWVTIEADGQLTHALTEGKEKPQQGQTLTFEVVTSDNKHITVKVVSDQSSDTRSQELSSLLKEQLSQMGLQDTDRNVGVLKVMHAYELPIAKGEFQSIKEALFYIKEAGQALASTEGDKAVNWQLDIKTFASQLKTLDALPLAQSTLTPTPTPLTAPPPVDPTLSQVQTAGISGDQAADLDHGLEKTLTTNQPQVTPDQESAVALKQGTKGPHLEQTDKGIVFQVGQQPAQVKDSSDTLVKHYQHFNQALAQDLIALSDNENRAAQTIGFIKQHSLPLTGLTLVIVDKMLTGSLGINQGIEAVFEGVQKKAPELFQVLKGILRTPMDWEKLDQSLDGQKLKELLEEASQVKRVFEEVTIKSLTGEKVEQLDLIKQTQSLLNDNAINWQAVYIPMQVQKQLEDVEIYIKGDGKKKGRLNPDDCLIYIALHTKNMSTIKVKIRVLKDHVRLDVITENPQVQAFMKSHAQDLLDRLKPLTPKEIVLGFSQGDDTTNLAELEKVTAIGASAFDVRV